MTDLQLYCAILLFIGLPLVLFVLFKRKEYRVHKARVLAATIIKEENNQNEEIKKRQKASVTLQLINVAMNHYLLVLRNTGGVTLKNVGMKILLQEHEDNPFLPKEFEKKFPIRKLPVGKSVTLKATQYAGTPSIYNIRVSWTEPSGSRVEDQIYVNV